MQTPATGRTCSWHVIMVPAGILYPARVSSSSSSRVTTGTTEYLMTRVTRAADEGAAGVITQGPGQTAAPETQALRAHLGQPLPRNPLCTRTRALVARPRRPRRARAVAPAAHRAGPVSLAEGLLEH
jgi:hypothetical protein